MKYMTNAQIDELNLLLDKHGAALTAFYNEGMRQGAKNVIHGMMIGAAIIAGVQITRAIITQAKELNRNWGRLISGSFFAPCAARSNHI